MKLLISRGRYARITAGLGPADIQEVDDRVQLYPEQVESDWHVDQARIAAAYDRLSREQPTPVRVPAFGARGYGKASVRLPAPWQQLGPGVWIAPVGTPQPVVDDSARTARCCWINEWVTAESVRAVREAVDNLAAGLDTPPAPPPAREWHHRAVVNLPARGVGCGGYVVH